MNRIVRILSAVFVALAMMACGGGDSFRITGRINGMGTQNLNVVYYADGAVHSTRTAAIDGKFMFDGASRDWTVVYFFTNTRALLGMAIVRNGENVDAVFDHTEWTATKLEGNRPSEQLGKWLAHSGQLLSGTDDEALNRSIEEFIDKNRDNLASTVILINFYRPLLKPQAADSLMSLIESKARPGYLAESWVEQMEHALDSTRITLPESMEFLDIDDYGTAVAGRGRTLILYSPATFASRNTATDTLLSNHLKKELLDSLKIEFIEIDRDVADTLTWKRSVRNDDVPWKRLWHPFNAGMLPWGDGEAVIVADSAGNIIYNGADVDRALKNANL